jgi:hypothetical protein
MSIFCFDIDDTICKTEGMDYESSAPFVERIAKINKLYEAGHTIKFFTARGSKTGIDWTEVTKLQLQNWGVKYHELQLGKPFADYYIDDKGISDKDFDWK